MVVLITQCSKNDYLIKILPMKNTSLYVYLTSLFLFVQQLIFHSQLSFSETPFRMDIRGSVEVEEEAEEEELTEQPTFWEVCVQQSVIL